jgi:energy-coupling factor transporter ATP-binding protein EcfA2
MKTLRRTIRKSEVGGEPLPAPFQVFERAGIVLRRAEVTVIAGTPGAGKSSIALHIAARLKQPTLYFSADTNAHTMAMRLISMSGKMTQQAAENLLKNNPDIAERILADNAHLYWSFESSPSLKDIDEEVAAFETIWGRSPTLIVVDNLMDVALDGFEEFAAMRQIMKELKFLARDTNACVLVLHHTQEGSQGYPCQPRSALQGKVAQIPAMVLTVGQQMLPNGIDSYLCVAPVKNRYGRADQTGQTYVQLSFDPERMYLEDVVRDYTQETIQEDMHDYV